MSNLAFGEKKIASSNCCCTIDLWQLPQLSECLQKLNALGESRDYREIHRIIDRTIIHDKKTIHHYVHG